MDDMGVADAFYTVLSVGIVLIAALAVSSVVLSTTAGQGKEAAAQLGDFGAGGMKQGLYSFYYAVDEARSDYMSGDPGDIVLARLASEGADEAIDFNAGTAPPSAPGTMGTVIWSGYLYVPKDGTYELELASTGAAWVWVDGSMVAENHYTRTAPSKNFTLELARGHHAFKAKYFYPELGTASCSLSWKQGGGMHAVGTFYR